MTTTSATGPAELTGWGRFGAARCDVVRPLQIESLTSDALPPANLIARGLGRSYGDAAQLDGATVVDTTACRGVEWLDRNHGVVRVDAGTTIGDLIGVAVPLGWFVPVTPGTRNVTIGGAIAADIHGKNHHRDGSIGNHVQRLSLRLADDSVWRISPADEPLLFWATIGGMGLTGIVLDVDLQLTPIASSYVQVETSRHRGLDELLQRMRASDTNHTYSVAWVDLLAGGRSVLTQGDFADRDQMTAHPAGPLRRPATPVAALPPLPKLRYAVTPGVRLFNELWWRRAPAEPTTTLESITAFFHPLDAIANWNIVYGPTGFVQWQCVVPDIDALGSPDDSLILDLCRRLGELPSFFSVLKRFGASNRAPLSFPMPGWTLAVDLPATARVLESLPELDRLVVDAGGRLYLAKDARMSAEVFEASHPRLDEWRAVRRSVDPGRRFSSDLARRLGL